MPRQQPGRQMPSQLDPKRGSRSAKPSADGKLCARTRIVSPNSHHDKDATRPNPKIASRREDGRTLSECRGEFRTPAPATTGANTIGRFGDRGRSQQRRLPRRRLLHGRTPGRGRPSYRSNGVINMQTMHCRGVCNQSVRNKDNATVSRYPRARDECTRHDATRRREGGTSKHAA